MSCCTIVFAKNPVPNQVKTRLRPLLSPEGAASLYRSFLVDWCNALSEIIASDLVIAYTPPDGLRNLKTLIGGNAVYVPQGESGLGDRLTAMSQWACEHGYDKFLIVGSDSPTLPIAYVDEAIELLDSREIVVGPSTDGGYYLIGFSKRGAARAIPAIFEGIAWSTEHVFRRTLEKVDTANAKLGLLPPWYDVDTPPDLQFLRDHLFAMRLAGCRAPIPRTERELEKWLG
ncbi:MAG: TIGR04282 family arsenosugar biosynthesis glycosyltransferase [Candidatus Poribacteria bacterium]|nr:TIGR04282 family arsenosugar biosynthesis glycosyltransferase [Candidatus Poribacteria bacterium]MDE0506229.1 TIGR04282 family arsenosugar biosynthesis glycosyltransferase [Candidatus Poribacteria bacterium]